MKRSLWPTRDPVKDYFPLPKEIFSLGLSAAEIAIYAFLLFCEDRQTFQCWPSYRKIGEAVRLSPNAIRKHIRSLEERDLLVTEPTQVTTKDGCKRNGNLLFTIRPIQAALQQDYDRQMQKLDEDMAKRKYADFIEKHRLNAQPKRQSQLVAPVSAVCAAFAAKPSAYPPEARRPDIAPPCGSIAGTANAEKERLQANFSRGRSRKRRSRTKPWGRARPAAVTTARRAGSLEF